MSQGYYSLMQYCPDWTRLEVCNIGVLLFCPDAQYLDAIVVQNCSRVHTIFGKKHDLSYVKLFKDHFANRIRNERDHILNLNALKVFISQQANYFRITEPRSMLVKDTPDQELKKLFREVFGEIAKPQGPRPPSLRTLLRKKVREYGLPENRVIFDLPKIIVPGFSATIQPCLGFMNGKFNLVVPQRFTAGHSLTQIGRWLLTGQKIHEKKSEIWGEQQINLLVDADNDCVVEQIEENRPSFDSHHIVIHAYVNDMQKLISDMAIRISDVAKEIPQDVLSKMTWQSA